MAQPGMFVKQAKKRGPPSSRDGNASQDSEKWMNGLLCTNKVSMEKSLGMPAADIPTQRDSQSSALTKYVGLNDVCSIFY